MEIIYGNMEILYGEVYCHAQVKVVCFFLDIATGNVLLHRVFRFVIALAKPTELSIVCDFLQQ